jgi:cell division protein ZapA (FtsZ GTPase activity inhibitor)
MGTPAKESGEQPMSGDRRKSEYRLSIQGREVTIRSDESSEHVEAIESLLNERVSALGPGVPLHNAMMLAALSLADELIKERDSHHALKEKIRKRSTDLLARLSERNLPT